MPAYDGARFSPPAPLAYVTLRNPATGVTETDVPLLIDTGADVTLLPSGAIARLNIPPDSSRKYELVGFDGSSSVAPVVELELIFCRRSFHGQFLLIQQEWGILGRNVLNAVPLVLNGPGLSWDELAQSPR